MSQQSTVSKGYTIYYNKYVLSRCTLHVRGGFLLLLNCCILDNIIQYRHF